VISTQELAGAREDRRRHGHLLLALVLAEDVARQRLKGACSAHFWLAQLDAVVGDGPLARRADHREISVAPHLERALLLNDLEGGRADFGRPFQHLVERRSEPRPPPRLPFEFQDATSVRELPQRREHDAPLGGLVVGHAADIQDPVERREVPRRPRNWRVAHQGSPRELAWRVSNGVHVVEEFVSLAALHLGDERDGLFPRLGLGGARQQRAQRWRKGCGM
jgi:hypothetical protein